MDKQKGASPEGQRAGAIRAGAYARGLAALFLYAAARKALVVWTALGAALVFYGFASRLLAVLLLAFVIGGSSITVGSPSVPRLGRLSRIGMAFALGLAWGAAAALSESTSLPPAELARFTAESFVGTVASDSRRTASGNTMMKLELAEIRLFRPGLSAVIDWPRRRPLVLLVTDNKEDFHAGRRIEARRLSSIDPEKALYYASAQNLRAYPFTSAAARLRSVAKTAFAARIAAVSGTAFPLAQALLLGVTDEIDGAESRLFRDAGCAHILSLSGQHLSILCMLMTLLVARLLKRSDLADIASLAFSAAFTWLAGAGPSLLRSTLMVFAGILLKKMDRPQQGITILSLAFCVGLGLKPTDARSLSFTLSYAAMAGLIILSPRWESLLWRMPPFLSKPLSASLAAICATAAISISTFGSIASGGIIAATLSGPVVLVFMWSLLGASALGAVLPFLDGLFSRWHEIVHGALLLVMKLGAILPPLKLESEAGKVFASAAIAALSLFVYAYPYGEYALHRILRARRAVNVAPQEHNDDSLRFPSLHKDISRSPGTGDVQALRPEFPRRPQREGKALRGARNIGAIPCLGDRSRHRRDDGSPP